MIELPNCNSPCTFYISKGKTQQKKTCEKSERHHKNQRKGKNMKQRQSVEVDEAAVQVFEELGVVVVLYFHERRLEAIV